MGGAFFPATLEVAGLVLGGLGGGFPPLLVLVVVLLLLLLLPPSSPTLTQRLRCGSIQPPLLPASHVPNPYSTETAMLGSFPNLGPSSVTPTRCVRPPPSHHSTRSPGGVRTTQLRDDYL